MRKRTARILTGIGIVLIVIGVAYAIAVGTAGSKLKRTYAALEKAGRPMKIEDVISPEVDDTENAALLYESAALLLKAQPAPEGNLLRYLGGLSSAFLKEPMDAGKRAELEQLMGQEVVDRALSVVEQATGRATCRFDVNYNAGINVMLPHLGDLRDLGRVLAVKVCLEAEGGNSGRAWELVQTQLKFADATLNEPMLVSQLVRIAMMRVSCDAIEKLCEIAAPNEKQTQVVDELLKGLDDLAPMVRAIDGERLLFGEWAFGLSKDELSKMIMEHISDSHGSGLLHRLHLSRITFKPLFLADRAVYMRLMHEAAESVGQPQIEIVDSENAVRGHRITELITPAVGRVIVLQRRMIANVRMVRGGLALLRHREAQGAFPETLEAIGLEGLDDPFSDKPLRYKTEEQGFVIYSIDADGEDNEGKGRPKKVKEEKGYDIVWRFGG